MTATLLLAEGGGLRPHARASAPVRRAQEDGGGAGRNAHVERVLGLCEVARDVGMTLKVNTVRPWAPLLEPGASTVVVPPGRRVSPARGRCGLPPHPAWDGAYSSSLMILPA